MSLLFLDRHELDHISTTIHRMYVIGEIDEDKRDSIITALRTLPSLEHGEVYLQDNNDDDDDDDGYVEGDILSSLIHNGIFTPFKWVTDDVEYTYGMCNSPHEAIEFTENREELHDLNYVLNLQEYREDTMPSTDFDLVAGYWGKYLFSIVITGKE